MRDFPDLRGLGLIAVFFAAIPAYAAVSTVADLMTAVNNGSSNATIDVGPGTFSLTSGLKPKAGMTIRGAGAGLTIITAASSWSPGATGLPEDPVNLSTIDRTAYLFDLGDGPRSVTISNMTLTGPQHRGAIFGNNCDSLVLYNLHIESFLWSSVRLFNVDYGKIHDNVLLNAGGKYGSETPGAIFVAWIKNSEIWNNHIYRTSGGLFYGIKGRGETNCRVHNNTIEVDFSIEFPFETDQNVEIDHNALWATVSIPKSRGGNVFAGGYSFHIHHNWFKQSYSIEGPRNSLIVDHNLFDFATSWDDGNLLSCWPAGLASGPYEFHNNLIKNPGRGLCWIADGQNNVSWHNNHVIANKTHTPRTDGLFGILGSTNYSTVSIKDNIFECREIQRPLMRQGFDAKIENNTLIGISDTSRYANPSTGAPRGPLEKLSFTCGVNGEFTVDDWNAFPSPLAALPRHAGIRDNLSQAPAEISIVDLRGRMVRRIAGATKGADLRRIVLDASDRCAGGLAPGRYLVYSKAGNFEDARVLTIVK